MVDRYILHQVSSLFFPLFFTLLFIASVVLFIKISSLTSLISVTFYELFFLFFYSIPTVLFFVLPLALFIAFVIVLNRLSVDFELPSLFSLGLNPKTVLKNYLYLASASSVVLLLISLILVPLSTTVYNGFLERKQESNALNIRSSEVGQKFGDWLIYIEGSDGALLKNVVLFTNKAFNDDSLVYAKTASVATDSSDVILDLEEGMIVIDKEEYLDTVLFDKMNLINSMGANREPFGGVFEHWGRGFEGDSKRAKEFAQSLLISLFPILSIYFVTAFGLIQPRAKTVLTYLYIGAYVGAYYGVLYFVSITAPFYGSLLFIVLFLSLGYFLYKYAPSKLF